MYSLFLTLYSLFLTVYSWSKICIGSLELCKWRNVTSWDESLYLKFTFKLFSISGSLTFLETPLNFQIADLASMKVSYFLCIHQVASLVSSYWVLLKAAVPAFHLTVSHILAVWCRPFRSLQLYFWMSSKCSFQKVLRFSLKTIPAIEAVRLTSFGRQTNHQCVTIVNLYHIAFTCTCTCCFDGQSLLLSWALSRGCTACIQCIHVTIYNM